MKWFPWAVCVLLLLLLLQQGLSKRTSPVEAPSASELETNYWTLYPRNEALYLRDIERLPDGIGAVLTLHSTQDLDHYEYAIDDGAYQQSRGPRIIVGFDRQEEPGILRSGVRIRAVTKDGERSRDYHVGLKYVPDEHYAASGRSSSGSLIVGDTDLLWANSSVDDWAAGPPTEPDADFAREQWGQVVDQDRTDLENAVSLARVLVDSLEEHRGTPSDKMDELPPFEQYQRAVAGADQVWCGNIADIFINACSALGIRARSIQMGHPIGTPDQETNDYRMWLAEGHRTTEVFCRNLNRWVWIDLTFRIMNASLGDEAPANTAEFHRYMNEPALFESLRITLYDPRTQSDKSELVSESKKRRSLQNYFKRDQRFQYSPGAPE
jgi:hypothetical protein